MNSHKGSFHFEETGLCISNKILSSSGRRKVFRQSPVTIAVIILEVGGVASYMAQDGLYALGWM